MATFDSLYNWILDDIIGFTVSTSQAYMLEPFALLLTYLAMFLLLASLWYLIKWVVQFISRWFPWY